MSFVQPARARLGRVVVLAVTLLALLVGVLTASAAGAHNTSTCYHGDVPNGGWYTEYLYHYWAPNNDHINVYLHWLYGTRQHYDYNKCN